MTRKQEHDQVHERENEHEQVNESFVADVLKSYRPPGNSNPLKPKEVDWVRNPDGSVLLDHNGMPLSVDRLLATKPLRQELSSRPGPGNKKLTYLSGEGVTRTLNEVFGFDGWNLEVKNTTREQCVKDDKSRFHVAYTATVRLTHRRSGAYKEDCGAADATDRAMGTAIANALKASITDALKRAARHFGDKLGNSLYQGDFTINKAPNSLKQALDQYAIDRANSKFGIQTQNWNQNWNTALITSPVVKTVIKTASPQNVRVEPIKEPIKQATPVQNSLSNVYQKKTAMPPPPAHQAHHAHQHMKVTIMPVPQASVQTKPQSRQTSLQTPLLTPKLGPSAMPMVTPGTIQPPPTPGQRLQGSQLFGLTMFAAGSQGLKLDANAENQPPSNNVVVNRPGTSTGLQPQRPGVGPFAGKKRAADALEDGLAKKPTVAVQRVNPYAV